MMCSAVNPTTSTAQKPQETAGRGIAELIREDLAPVQPGVVVVAVRDASLMTQARALFEECALYAKKVADLPMPRAETLHSLYGDGTRDLPLARGFAGRDARQPLLDKQMFFRKLTNCRRLNGWSNEGVHIVLEHLPEGGGYVTAEASISETREQIFAALERMEAEARVKNARILLFVEIGKDDIKWLYERCEELIVIDECEPGPGGSQAFSLTAMSLKSQHTSGIGRTMCEVVEKRGRIVRSQTVFIAALAEDRCIWYLAKEKKYSPESIADLFDIARTTVWRRLKAMPLSVRVDVDTGLRADWRDVWFPFLGIEFGSEVDENDDEGDVDPAQHRNQRI